MFLLEWGKNSLQSINRNADSCISNRYLNKHGVGILFAKLRRDRDASFCGELDRVPKKIEDDLFHPQLVTNKDWRNVSGEIHSQDKPLFMQNLFLHHRNILNDLKQ